MAQRECVTLTDGNEQIIMRSHTREEGTGVKGGDRVETDTVCSYLLVESSCTCANLCK